MSSTNLTIVILTNRNDERFVNALASAQFADEILIYDDDSKNTWEVLKKKYNFTIKKISRFHSFSTVRNLAKKDVMTPWTFFLDSDEYISKPLREEILRSIEDSSTIAYRTHRVDVFAGEVVRFGEVANSNPVRLIQTKYIHWQGAAHEELTIPPEQKQSVLHTPLLHLAHVNLSEFLSKINTYTTLLAEEKKESMILVKLLLYPLGKFTWTFFFKSGFRDGMRGLVYSFMMSIHSLTVRVKRYEKATV